MEMLLAAALAPAVLLMWYVYTRDKVEKEPMKLVMRTAGIGAASVIVAAIVEYLLISALESSMPEGTIRIIVEYFLCVALVEELCKFFSLNTIKKRPEFDYLFDAVVYSVAAALGFAALENVVYVFEFGMATALMRAVLSVPGHAAYGVVMGVFYGLACQRKFHGKSGAGLLYCLAILLPTIEHGFYDAALSLDSDTMVIVAVICNLAFIVLAFVLVRRMAAKDEPLHPRGPMRGQVPLAQPGGVPFNPSQYTQPSAPYSAPAPSSGVAFGAAVMPPAQQPVAAGSFSAPIAQQGAALGSPYAQPMQQPVAGATPYVQPTQVVQQSAGVPANVQPLQQQPVAGAAVNAQPAAVQSAQTAVAQPVQASVLAEWFCTQCGTPGKGNFCVNCGNPRPETCE